MKYLNKKLICNNINAHKLRGDSFFKDTLDENNELLKLYIGNIKQKSNFKCKLCGKDKGKEFLEWKEGYFLIQCDYCNVVSANIKHTGDGLYDDDEHYDRSFAQIAEQIEYRKSVFGSERYDYTIKRLKLNPPELNVLDIGCGFGYYLSVLLEKGIHCKGLEVDKQQVKYCKEQGLNVVSGDINDEKNERYDLIVMFDVLEHLYNPLKYLKSVFDKVKINGYLIAYTPNIHSLSFELMEEKQNLLHPFQHICFYNKDSLQYIADHLNLEIVSIDYFGLDVMDYLMMKEHEDEILYTKKLYKFVNLMQSCLDNLQISNHMRITFKKIKRT